MSLAKLKTAAMLVLLAAVVLMDSLSMIVSACVDLVFCGLLVLVAMYWPNDETCKHGDSEKRTP